MFKRIASLGLTAIMLLGSAVSVQAADISRSGGNGNSKVTVDVASRTFRVTVPSVLPIWVDSDNNVTVANNAKIRNLSEGPVDVTNVSVEADNGWSLVPFNTDFKKVPVGTKQYGMTMYGDDVVDGVDLSLFDRIDGSNEISVVYNGSVAIQQRDINKADIGHVVFTVAWADEPRLGVNDITYNVENAAVQKHMATAAYNDNDHSYTYLDQADCVVANQKPAYGVLSVADGATSIVVTSKADGKTFTDTISGNEYHVQNLIPNVVYDYQMKNSAGTTLKQGKIYPTGKVRMIAPNDDSIVSNMRDIGGVAANGGTLKYGKLYRGEALNGDTEGHTNSITDQFGAYMADFLGITYEQDLRQANEYAEYTESAIKNASYVRTPLVSAQVSTAYFSNSPQVTTLTNLVNHLANGDVTYLHCMGGVDRTGGILLILEGALGISLSDIEHRQELSFWSSRNRTLEGTDGNYAHIMEYPRGTTLEEKCINFMMAHGISADAINRMRANLIDGTPALVEGITPQEVYDASTSLLNTRMTSSTPRANDGTLVTNYIDYEQEAQFEITLDTANNTGTYNGWFEVYDENYTRILRGTSTYGTWKWGSDGKTAKWIPGGSSANTAYTAEGGWAYKNPKYIRFCFAYSDPTAISIKRVF